MQQSLSASNESLSRVLIRSAEQTTEHTLPFSIIPSSPLTSTTRRTSETQTTTHQFSSKSTPSFADTQLLSVYYLDPNASNVPVTDHCTFVEQQDRQPVRFRQTYDPVAAAAKSTQTLTFHANERTNPKSLAQNSSSSHERSEEYTVYVDEKLNRTSSASSTSSSVTTVIEQSQDLNRSSLIKHHPPPVDVTNQRVSSWPPVPDDSLLVQPQDQNASTRVRFAEQLVREIPVSTISSLSEETRSPPAVAARRTQVNTEQASITGVDPQLVREQLQRLDYHPKNQSNWIRTRVDQSDIPVKVTSNRVNTLKTLFEQSTVHSSTSTTHSRKVESEERPSRYGDEIRFYAKNSSPSTIHHAELVKVIEQPTTSSTPSDLDLIRQIIGKQIETIDDLGHYLQDGQTWQWDEVFWLGLTTSQRDQLKDLEPNRLRSSSNEAKRFKSTINIVGAGAWQQNKSPPLSSSSVPNITKYSEVNSFDENQSSVSVISSAPTSNYVRADSQESMSQQQVLTSTKRSDSQITMIESGYSSADEQQRFRRPQSGTIIEESPSHRTISKEEPAKVPKLDPLSYEQFISDYFSRHAQHVRANDGTLLLSIDGQQIPMSHIHVPSSSDQTLTLANSIYIDAIDKYLSPFETEADQLIIFLNGEAITLAAEHWLIYREKYSKAPWVRYLKRINRDIPEQLIPIIEQWLADHATLSCDTHELHVNGLTIPLLGRLGLHLLDSYSIRQLPSDYWKDVLTYLLCLGYISYDPSANVLRIAHTELDVRRLLASPPRTHFETQIEMLIEWLNQISEQNLITINDQNDIVLFPDDQEQQILIDHEHIHSYMEGKDQQNAPEVISMNDIAHILLLHDYVQYSAGQLTYSVRDNKAHAEKYLPSDHQTVYNERTTHLSAEEKANLIDYYVEFVNDHHGIQYNNVRNLLLLENPLDHSQLYLTPEHTNSIRNKGYRKEDMKTILNESGHIERDEGHHYFLCYNDQRIRIPLKEIDSTNQDNDDNLTLLFPFDQSLRLIEKTSSTTTLDIEQPSVTNNYSIDPLLTLANYIHRAATIYQDERVRLVIKLYKHEIVIPRVEASQSIQAINASPQRTGTIIARLVQRLGRVQSTEEGGLIITVGRKSFELSKAVLESGKKQEFRRMIPSPKLPLLRHSKSASNLSSASIDRHPSFNDDQQMLYTKDGRGDARYLNLSYASSLENLCLSSCGTPRLIIIPDDEKFSSSNNTTRFYIQYTYEDDSTSVPHLITPQRYQDDALRSSRVYVRRQGEREICYENLADYLSTRQSELSSRTIRRMLKFTTAGEYLAYLSRQMSTNDAQHFVRESEQRSSSPGRSPHSLATPEKNITLPRSTSGQSNDGESESRATVSRSASAAAKVTTSKSDTMKSTTSSSAGSSREHPTVSSSVVRTQSLVSPNRTNGSKGGGDEVKKEKKSKFRTPSFLRKRKEKKEAAHKDKAEK